jgi:hypothetical protein
MLCGRLAIPRLMVIWSGFPLEEVPGIMNYR